MLTLIYNILDGLPFEWLSFQFMKSAFLAMLLITPLFGLLGTMVVSNKMAFFSETLGHSALTGIGLGVLLGLPNPLYGMIIFGILFAICLVWVKNMGGASTDTTIAVFSAAAIALGVVLLSAGGGFNRYTTYIVGDLLAVSPSDLQLLFWVLVGTLIAWVFVFNRLLLITLSPSLAYSRAVPVMVYEMLFTALVAVVVMVAIRWVGLLMINALLILPAAAAKNIARNYRGFSLFAVLFALFSGITGLVLSYYLSSATGATIVLAASVLYFVTLLWKVKFQ
ncbi:MAG: metal ABC transporter permease [Hyphomonadaceae bacterium]|nr:metal ABC transporter permease [Clostridia bacterium]